MPRRDRRDRGRGRADPGRERIHVQQGPDEGVAEVEGGDDRVVGAGHELLAKHEELLAATYIALDPRIDLSRSYAEAIGAMVVGSPPGIRRWGTKQMNELGPLSTYLVLASFIGAAEAANVA
jgi:hypothetical protein